MKTLFFECKMGASCDMLCSALLELLGEDNSLLNKIYPADIKVEISKVNSFGITGTNTKFATESVGHKHFSLNDVVNTIHKFNVDKDIKNDAIQIYKIIADAEAKVHSKNACDVHFHEVGSYKAISGVVSVCYLIKKLNVEKIMSSPICVGSGVVNCAHGVLPVPAPAVLELLKDVPIYSHEIESELCTVTGGALLKYFVDEFSNLPIMNIESIGYGIGAKELSRPNLLRAFLGDAEVQKLEKIAQLNCNIDDMTGEQIGFALKTLMENGAKDAYVVPIIGKKNRPAQLLTVLCKTCDIDRFSKLVLKHTTTLGVRILYCDRYTMDRHIESVDTNFGKVRIKKASGYGLEKSKFEYEDLAKISNDTGLSLFEIMEKLKWL